MIFGYIRVSTDKQDMDNQEFSLLKFINEKNLKFEKIIKEEISSRVKFEKRELFNLVEMITPKDILIISGLSRLGRSILEIMQILKILMDKKVEIFITRDNMELENNIQSKVLAFAFGLSAEIERDLISSRTKQALAKKKANGFKLGRPIGSSGASYLDDKKEYLKELLEKNISITSIAKLIEKPVSTLRHYIKSRNLKK